MKNKIIPLIIGLCIGGWLGIVTMALCTVAREDGEFDV